MRKRFIVEMVFVLMGHRMGDEKIEQNVNKLKIYLFHTLGCGTEDAKRIMEKVIERYIKNSEKKDEH